jgi:hypothetical protein
MTQSIRDFETRRTDAPQKRVSTDLGQKCRMTVEYHNRMAMVAAFLMFHAIDIPRCARCPRHYRDLNDIKPRGRQVALTTKRQYCIKADDLSDEERLGRG